MGGHNWAALERQEMARELRTVGPDAPTLCGDWTARDLTAHIVLREGRPDGAMGIVVPAMSGWTQRVQDGYAKRDFQDLINTLSEGPPLLSPFRLPGADRIGNTTEFFIHLEDVRRAQPDWQPRQLPQKYRDQLWSIVKQRGHALMRHSPVGIEMVRTDAQSGEPRFSPVKKSPTVIVSGPAPELLLFAFGRQEHSVLGFQGDPTDIERLVGADFSV